ncbi:MAG: pseudouridine synthase [Patescibacteria group bacterium]
MINQMRINKFIAASTKLSRRQADAAIEKGRVTVNGQPLADFSYMVTEKDIVMLDDKELAVHPHVYYALNKPVGVTSTTADPHAEKCVTDLVPKTPPVVPVGRLDKDSRGLLLLSNDGDFIHQLTHPSYEHEKEYVVTVDKPLADTIPDVLQKGIRLDEGLARADRASIESKFVLRMTIHQGWNRQIRRMLSMLSYDVVDLLRVRIGEYELAGLPEGEYTEVSPENVLPKV